MPQSQPHSANPNWRGGRTIASSGYILIKLPGHPLADSRGYVYEHRAVAMEALGRPLRRGEVVHHRNGDKLDNRPENLEVLPGAGVHMTAHATRADLLQPGQPNELATCACGCGTAFPRFDYQGRPRRFVAGHNARAGTGRFG